MTEELKPCPFCGTKDLNLFCYEVRHGEINCTCHADWLEMTKDSWNARPIEDALQKQIDELRAQIPRWIPVTERLPIRGHYVMIMTVAIELPHIGKHSKTIQQWETIDGLYFHDISYSQVTHWMPLPEPPTENLTDSHSF